MELLKHRVAMSLEDQYSVGVNGSLGDHDLIVNSMRVHRLRHVERFPNSISMFVPGAECGMSFDVMDMEQFKQMMFSRLSEELVNYVCMARSTGELILTRQLYILQLLNIFVQDVLDVGSRVEGKSSKRSKKPEKAAREALSNLSLEQKPEKLLWMACL